MRIALLVLLFTAVVTEMSFAADEAAPKIFEQRILPILQSPKPSSCAECHLSGVDLKEYIRPTQQETFASLVKADLVDLKKPENSKLLKFIERKPEKPSLITDKIRKAEYDAFAAWIKAALADPKLLAAKDAAAPIGPQLPDEVIRHARRDRVLASFVENVWAEVGRCAACHSPDRNQEKVKKHGEQVSWIKLNDPQATLDHMLEHELISLDEPEQSLILRKPLNQIEHGGGQKMVVGDRTYKQFRRFLNDYAAVRRGEYKSEAELPKSAGEVSLVSEIWFKLENVPEKFDKQLLQVDIYRAEGTGWTKARVATSDRPVFGKGKLWQHSLSLTAARDSQETEQLRKLQLPPGKYLVKIYVDQTGKLAKDFQAELGEEDFVGQVEFNTKWPAGYGQMTVVKFPAK